MADKVFFDPKTGRTFTWRQYVTTLKRQVRVRMPGVNETLLLDAVQYGLTDMERASTRHASLVDSQHSGLLHWRYAVRWGRQRACQYVARHSRKYLRHELLAGDLDDMARRYDKRPNPSAAASAALASLPDDPERAAGSRDMRAHVHRFYDTLPDDIQADIVLLFGASKREVAEQLDVTSSAVAQQRATLRRRIRKLAVQAGVLAPDGSYGGMA